jgi:hypothetical protein
MKLLDKHPGAGAVVVDKDNKVHVSDNMKSMITIVHAPTGGV